MIRVDRPGGAALVAALFFAGLLACVALPVFLLWALPSVNREWTAAISYTLLMTAFAAAVLRHVMPCRSWIVFAIMMAISRVLEAWLAVRQIEGWQSYLLPPAIAFAVSAPFWWRVRQQRGVATKTKGA